ncbi:membrane protein [Kitasatospora sp. NE20-6]
MARETSESSGRLKQIRTAYTMTKKVDTKIGLIIAGVGLITFGVFLAIGFAVDHPVYLGILGFVVAVLAMAVVFGRRAERAAFGQMEGQPGAVAAVLDNIRRGWNTNTTPVAVTRNQDAVYRAVGRPGIALIGEGNPNRVRPLLAAEKKKMARVVGDVPVHDIMVGNGEGEVPLKKLQVTLMRLPRSITPAQVTQTNDRLRALGDLLSKAPIPKGPMPKGARMPKGGQVR